MECLLVAAASAFTGFITLFLVNDCQPVGRDPKLTEVTKVSRSCKRQISFFMICICEFYAILKLLSRIFGKESIIRIFRKIFKMKSIFS